MEEVLKNTAGCRQVFERWMNWQPHEQAWLTFVNFELRHKEFDCARVIYSRFCQAHPHVTNWVRWAKFEERNGFVERSREVFEEAASFFEQALLDSNNLIDDELFIQFARFEERQKEVCVAATLLQQGSLPVLQPLRAHP